MRPQNVRGRRGSQCAHEKLAATQWIRRVSEHATGDWRIITCGYVCLVCRFRRRVATAVERRFR